jgi:hypothetical protein
VTTIGARDVPANAAGCDGAIDEGAFDEGTFAANVEEAADASLRAAAALDVAGKEADDGNAGELGSFGADWAVAASGKPAKAASAARSAGVDIVWSSCWIDTIDTINTIGKQARSPQAALSRARAQRFARDARTRRSRGAPPFGRYTGWRPIASTFPRVLSRSGIGRFRTAFAAMCASLTVAGAAQVGSVLADLTPCFPFNRARRAERASTKVGKV